MRHFLGLQGESQFLLPCRHDTGRDSFSHPANIWSLRKKPDLEKADMGQDGNGSVPGDFWVPQSSHDQSQPCPHTFTWTYKTPFYVSQFRLCFPLRPTVKAPRGTVLPPRKGRIGKGQSHVSEQNRAQNLKEEYRTENVSSGAKKVISHTWTSPPRQSQTVQWDEGSFLSTLSPSLGFWSFGKHQGAQIFLLRR